MDQWVLAILASVSIFLCFIELLLLPVNANSEGDALNALKTTVTDPNNVLQSWDPTLVNPCTWLHVTCNSENSVTRVDLGNANLSGPLVPQLGQLSNLQYLELYSNNISGRIPFELGNLTNLVSLDLYLNKLVGPIPETLGKLQKLRFLDLSNNHLTGPIPVNGSFSRFTYISFANNQLDIPPASPPPPISPTPTSPDCIALCKVRCKLHSKKKRVVCIRACTSCCLRCKCVPPGQYGNREKCGKCYANMTTRGGRRSCP